MLKVQSAWLVVPRQGAGPKSGQANWEERVGVKEFSDCGGEMSVYPTHLLLYRNHSLGLTLRSRRLTRSWSAAEARLTEENPNPLRYPTIAVV
jgi:hypothetical protein